MKKSLFLGILGVLLLGTSCSQEDFYPVVEEPLKGEATVSINVKTPENMMSRTYSDGKTVNTLSYAIYETTTLNGEKSYTRVGEAQTVEDFSLSTQLQLKLVTGHTYTIAFWAFYDQLISGEELAYKVEFGQSAANMSYYASSGVVSANTDDADAFFAHEEFTVNGDIQKNIELKRPFAQINFGTNDLEEYKSVTGKNNFRTNIKVKFNNTTYNKLNLLTGEVTGETPIEFFANTLTVGTAEKFPVPGYQYVGMAYVLVGEDQELVDATLVFVDPEEGSRTVTNVPIRRNYRTNIYGQILTSNVGLNVKIEPAYEEPDYMYQLVWDGKTVTYPQEIDGKVNVNTASDIAGLAELVNEGDDFEGKTIVLNNDFDLANNPLTIATGVKREGSGISGTPFKGEFDGQNHIISNLVLRSVDNEDEGVGFFGVVAGKDAVVKNITFKDVKANCEQSKMAGIVAGALTDGATISGIKIEGNSYIVGKQGVGGIVGRLLKSGKIEYCENNALVKTSEANAGGIVGAAYYTEKGSEMVIKGCKNFGIVEGSSNAIGGIVGLSCAEVIGCTNEGSVTGSAASVGGIVGEQKSAGSIKNCINNGEVIGGQKGGDYGAGGIVGWIRYDNSSSYSVQNVIEVSGCTNKSNITGWTGVGGIVGAWYRGGICTGNKNFATSITAKSQFVAGIVGNSQFLGNSPENIEGYEEKQVISDNISTTSIENISGGNKDLYVYRNDASKVEGYDTNKNSEN